MTWLVFWLGVATAACLVATIALGILFRRVRLKVFKYHRTAGIITVALGACHGAVALAFWIRGIG